MAGLLASAFFFPRRAEPRFWKVRAYTRDPGQQCGMNTSCPQCPVSQPLPTAWHPAGCGDRGRCPLTTSILSSDLCWNSGLPDGCWRPSCTVPGFAVVDLELWPPLPLVQPPQGLACAQPSLLRPLLSSQGSQAANGPLAVDTSRRQPGVSLTRAPMRVAQRGGIHQGQQPQGLASIPL